MTREQSYALAFEKQRNTLSYKTAAQSQLIENLTAQNAEFAGVNSRLSALGARLAITALSSDGKALSALQSEMTDLSAKRNAILKSAGIGDIAYDCNKCQDTGYINGKICDCIHTAAKQLLINDLSSSLPLEKCRFENFDLNYYQTTDDSLGNPRKRMTQILKLCREYTISFDPHISGSLLFMGNTGLGKTHLTLAIVYELLNRGFDVIYGSSYNLFGEMETEHFKQHTNTSYTAAINCDLLVIDDLGGEFVSPYIQSLLYNVINTRDLSGKPTIINTNLTMSEIAERYTPRVASRLIKYTAKKFIGNDIRQLKAIEKQSV
ncbi:MAG: ATP-binding protein [Clostridia bacterium]|nr:ATP-binding protein [Clostridia bacterium]